MGSSASATMHINSNDSNDESIEQKYFMDNFNDLKIPEYIEAKCTINPIIADPNKNPFRVEN